MLDTNDDFTSAIAVEDDGPVQTISTQNLPSQTGGEFAPLAQLYGYDNPTEGQRSQLEYIWEYFKEEGKGPGETLEALRDVERSLAAPELGQSKLSQLYSYIRLCRASEDMDAERRSYLRDDEET